MSSEEFSASLNDRLDKIVARSEELQHLLSTEISGDEFIEASREYADLTSLVELVHGLRNAEEEAKAAEEMLQDPEMKDLAEAELEALNEKLPALRHQIRLAMLPKDKADAGSAILEIRPAAGGDEAGLFAAELFGAYQRYSDAKGWRFEVMEYDDTGVGGIKGAMASISGTNVFARMKYESGVHRVQRVPATESQGRIHTSTVTVAVLPEAEDVDVEIDEKDLRIDVYRASGAGGQHVNKTESAVRITHIPSGVVVAMQEEKSQHKNKAKAMKILRARLYEQQRAAAHADRAENRRSQVGTGDRSERIRTYNFPQGRVTDHRINLTLHKIDRIMLGEFDEIVDSLAQEEQSRLLAAEEAM
ncbi:peptide chain release factor 1 [Commensalibacter oyaizuii]|uniref:Peptide chain release factor 1 n=1 Tax=Commensalibacter oyaizuii TaxID=3043873 RepID=A0ABT6Q112_9PROT|nr:peptide chain release factor 1 [Commensalibacter sp. TBRC 16381]MDI2090802.1 peptide chain release factor 1 [Commensalibacter sp. TBRC 16381]